MDVQWQLPTPTRPNNLKRRATFEDEENDIPFESPTQDAKKHRQRSAIDNICLVPLSEAWDVDLTAILPHNQSTCPSMYILCVVGSLTIHHDILCSLLSHLPSSSSLWARPLLLIPSPTSTRSNGTSSSYYASISATPSPAVLHLLTQSPLPVLPTPSQTFIRLGLFHPSGTQPLDAIVVLDWRGRRRLVVPFGWGAGKWVGEKDARVLNGDVTAVAGQVGELVGALREGVAELMREWEGSADKVEWELRKEWWEENGQAKGGAREDEEMAIDET
ncbi:MAG: hypothetical protein M1820_009947 [Bogoriella megaspora]|nr:MAG: hypothetical protein M1820_009947 [Bogoriella megaspora]